MISSKQCLICNDSLADNQYEINSTFSINICKSCIINVSPKRKTAKEKIVKYSSLPQRRKHRKNSFFKLKMKVINGYGGKCVCCDENNPFFLTIDHINNDGADERKSKGYTHNKFLNSIIDDKFPPQYRLLCFNCNLSRGFYGQCYHQLCKTLNKDSVSISEYKDIIYTGADNVA
jgi:hypothetical protein